METVLRPYQRCCIDSVFHAFEKADSTLAVLATGLGKTVIFNALAGLWPEGRVLVLAHREELVFQAKRSATEWTGIVPDIEMAGLTALSDLYDSPKIVIGSVASMCREGRLARFNPDDFRLVIWDECHHCVPDNGMYWRIFQHFRRAGVKHLGVTATADRADGKSLKPFFETVCYQCDILQGIEGGWLVPIDQQYVTVKGLDFSQVRSSKGDLNESDLQRVMMEEEVLHRVVSPTIDIAGNEPTLIFASGVAHAQAIAEILNRHRDQSAVCLHGKSDGDFRRESLRNFAAGKFQFLVGCGIFTEGFDCPRISVVVMARPTKSRALYTQCIGRGTRTLPGVLDGRQSVTERQAAIAASPKPRVLVLDLVGNSGRHKLISTADLLGGNLPEEVRERAVRNLQKKGGPADMREALEEARGQLEAEEKRRQERRNVKAHSQHSLRAVNPFDVGDQAANRSSGYERWRPATPKQRAVLERHGYPTKGMSFRAASKLLSNLPASEAQKKTLAKYGESVDGLTMDKATALFAILQARHWKPRNYPLSRDRWSILKKGDTYTALVNDPAFGKIEVGRPLASVELCRDFIGKCLEQREVEGVPA